MKKFTLIFIVFTVYVNYHLTAQDAVPIQNYSINSYGCVEITVESSTDYYYLLYNKYNTSTNKEIAVSMTLGQKGTTVLTERAEANPQNTYRVVRWPISAPGDYDGDGRKDLAEFNNAPTDAHLNRAAPIAKNNGTTCIPTRAIFEDLSYKGDEVLIDTHLKNLEFVKFYLLYPDEVNGKANPYVYFMNTETHRSHGSFSSAISIARGTPEMRGEIVYLPNIIAPNDENGVYRFEFEPNDNYPFAKIQLAYEFIVSNIYFLKNNWVYYPMNVLTQYNADVNNNLYGNSRVTVLTSSGQLITNTDDISQPVEDYQVSNYPNPFSEQTTITYNLASDANVQLTIINSLGQVVNTLVQEKQAAGNQSVLWNGTDFNGNQLSAGLYHCKLSVNDNADFVVSTTQLMLVK